MPITAHSTDTQLLLHEQWAIELLARETNTSIAKVQEVFLGEYARIALKAHVTAFLPLLTCKRVRATLGKGTR
jgi:hypothetical protein